MALTWCARPEPRPLVQKMRKEVVDDPAAVASLTRSLRVDLSIGFTGSYIQQSYKPFHTSSIYAMRLCSFVCPIMVPATPELLGSGFVLFPEPQSQLPLSGCTSLLPSTRAPLVLTSQETKNDLRLMK